MLRRQEPSAAASVELGPDIPSQPPFDFTCKVRLDLIMAQVERRDSAEMKATNDCLCNEKRTNLAQAISKSRWTTAHALYRFRTSGHGCSPICAPHHGYHDAARIH